MSGVPLEPGGDDVRALTEEALEYLVEFTEGRRDALASDLEGVDELVAALRMPAPE